MSEATPQDGSTVKGYRTLSHGEIGKMNQFKELSRQFLAMLAQHADDIRLNAGHADQAAIHESYEWLREAHKDMQRACMAACRSVAQPDSDC